MVSGGTPQPNPWTEPGSGTKDWVDFFRDQRIGHQLDLAGDSYCSNLWDNDVAPRLHRLFDDLQGEKEIRPSLLHGDLWSGNIGSADGRPSIFDPAVYWGHHEAEWGVSESFATKDASPPVIVRARVGGALCVKSVICDSVVAICTWNGRQRQPRIETSRKNNL